MEQPDATQRVLEQITTILRMAERYRSEQFNRGESFNLFDELGMATDEVHMHSAFLAILLDPKRSHGQAGKYLQAFVEMINEKSYRLPGPLQFDCDNAELNLEYYIGPISGETGGRIDIHISDKKGNLIVIENKINVGDQHYQMKRYWNYIQSVCSGDRSKYRLIYLTLSGHEPSSDSTNGLSSDEYICMSYQTDILQWLEKCLGQSCRLPMVRETINQYAAIVRQLTHTNMANSDEVLKIMSKKENIDAVFAIYEQMGPMINYVLNTEFKAQMQILAEEKHLTLDFPDDADWTQRYSGWIFLNPQWKHFYLRFEFNNSRLNGFFVGFHIIDGQSRGDIAVWDELCSRVSSEDKDDRYWIWKWFSKGYTNWCTSSVIKAIWTGELKKEISNTIDEFIERAKGLEI